MSYPTIGDYGWQEEAGTDECDDWFVVVDGPYDSIWLNTNLEALGRLIDAKFGRDQHLGGLSEEGDLFLAIPPDNPNLLLFVQNHKKNWEAGYHLDPAHYRECIEEEIQTRWDDGTLAERVRWVRQANLSLRHTKDGIPDPEVAQAIEDMELE